jgi:signal transduction histidine kinase
VDALEHLVGGFGTGILAMVALLLSIATALACLIGVGVALAPTALRVVRAVADRERARLSRRSPEIIGPEPLPDGVRAALTDRAVLREPAWMVTHAFTGLATNCPVPCRVDTDIPIRGAASVEATAYFVVAEALTDIAKHSQARNAAVKVRRHADRLHVQVTDDGQGGADEHSGSGLVGIRRRIEAHDGTFTPHSPPGGPTVLRVSLPCG